MLTQRQAHASSAARMDRAFVHKHSSRNVLLADDLERDGDAAFSASVFVDDTHPYFFEHPRGHVPGMYLVEAGRQFVLAVSHKFYGVPFGREFLMDEMQIRFTGLALLTVPIIAYGTTTNCVMRRGALLRMEHSGTIQQKGRTIMEMSGRTRICDPLTLERFESDSV
jgi:hypothetical protein